MKPLTAADVMKSNVLTVNSAASVLDAAMIMLRNKVSGLPVIDQRHTLVGIVTEGDLMRRSEIGPEPTARAWRNIASASAKRRSAIRLRAWSSASCAVKLTWPPCQGRPARA